LFQWRLPPARISHPSPSATEGELKQVKLLFSDVKSSMELDSRVDAEAWHMIPDRFFGIPTGGLCRFKETMNQYNRTASGRCSAHRWRWKI